MTDKEYAQLAESLFKMTTISYPAWKEKCKDPNYPRQNTNWWKGFDALHKIGVAPAPPPVAQLQSLGRNVMFAAWNPQAGLRAPVPKYKLAITADVHVTCAPEDSEATRQAKAAAYTQNAILAAQQQHQRGGLVACWGNQVQIGTQQIIGFGRLIGADYLIFQGETAEEYKTAIESGAQVIVGNSNSWTQAQREDATRRVNADTLAFIFETYTNTGDPWPIDSSSSGVPPASMCVGVGWGKTPYQLPDYQPHTDPVFWKTLSVYVAEDLTSASWAVLP